MSVVIFAGALWAIVLCTLSFWYGVDVGERRFSPCVACTSNKFKRHERRGDFVAGPGYRCEDSDGCAARRAKR